MEAAHRGRNDLSLVSQQLMIRFIIVQRIQLIDSLQHLLDESEVGLKVAHFCVGLKEIGVAIKQAGEESVAVVAEVWRQAVVIAEAAHVFPMAGRVRTGLKLIGEAVVSKVEVFEEHGFPDEGDDLLIDANIVALQLITLNVVNILAVFDRIRHYVEHEAFHDLPKCLLLPAIKVTLH